MKYYGKEKCRILKQIRAEIAKRNDIEWVVEECSHKGNCRGTCPKCEAEVRQLERALERRQALGKTVAVVGISAGLSLSVVGCANPLTETTDGVMVDPPANGNTETEQAIEGGMVVDGEMLLPDTEAQTFITGEFPLPGVPEIDTSEDITDATETLPDEELWEGEVVVDDWEDMPTAGDPLPEDYYDESIDTEEKQ